MRLTVFLLLLLATAHGLQSCADGTQCPDGDTCCPTAPAGAYACCPGTNSVCCSSTTCCAADYHCVASNATCVANNFTANPYDWWTLQYNLCQGPFHHHDMPDTLGTWRFPYYSSAGPIEAGSAEYRMAVVVQHGANRNADAYFCDMMQAVRLQTRFKPSEVYVVAPHFMQIPQDTINPEIVFWNGTNDSDGPWRSGKESAPNNRNQTISSYAIFDKFLEYLNRSSLYPNLQLITMAGHSSGGQMVQRYALTQRATKLGADGSRHFRYVVANPSSFCYLNGMRFIHGVLEPVPDINRTACPHYDDWQWGLHGDFPAYVDPDSGSYNATYDRKDVVYLQGLNDTCNEELQPGCHSHGLETTCMDMLEGRWRLERGIQYYKFLDVFYGRQVHNLSLVPNTSHDATHMFQSAQGLEAIFGPLRSMAPYSYAFTASDIVMTLVSLIVALLVLGLIVNRWARNGSWQCWQTSTTTGPSSNGVGNGALYQKLNSKV